MATTQNGLLKSEISLTEALGKTLDSFAFSNICNQAILVFTDNSFTTLAVDVGYERGYEEICESKLEIFNFGDDKLFSLGITSMEELSALREENRKDYAAAKEQRERSEYERLRRRFGED